MPLAPPSQASRKFLLFFDEMGGRKELLFCSTRTLVNPCLMSLGGLGCGSTNFRFRGLVGTESRSNACEESLDEVSSVDSAAKISSGRKSGSLSCDRRYRAVSLTERTGSLVTLAEPGPAFSFFCLFEDLACSFRCVSRFRRFSFSDWICL